MVHGGEVRAEGHVIEIGVSFGRSEGRVNELFVAGRIRDVPLFKVRFECFELSLREVVSKATRSAVGEEGDLAVLEAESFGGTLCGRIFLHGHFFSFSEVVPASVRSQLLGLAGEARVIAFTKHFRESFFERDPLPAPVGVRSQIALMSSRRIRGSAISSSSMSNWRRDMEHLISTPTGPG